MPVSSRLEPSADLVGNVASFHIQIHNFFVLVSIDKNTRSHDLFRLYMAYSAYPQHLSISS